MSNTETPMERFNRLTDVEMCVKCDVHPAAPDSAGMCASCFDLYYDGPPDDDDAWAGGFADNH